MDTKLSDIELTDKQISNFNSLITENIKGFAYWHGKKEVVVVSKDAVDIDALRSAISALPDEQFISTEQVARKEKKNKVLAKLKITEEEFKELMS